MKLITKYLLATTILVFVKMNPNLSPISMQVVSVFQWMPVTFLFWILQWYLSDVEELQIFLQFDMISYMSSFELPQETIQIATHDS